MEYKSRVERFDEVFRTLLVIASAFSGMYFASIPMSFRLGAFAWTLFLAAAIVVWSIAALWGDHPGANAARLAGLGMLSVHLAGLVLFLFVVIHPAVTGPFKFAESALPYTFVVAPTMSALGGVYLRVRLRQFFAALLVVGLAMVLWSFLAQALYSA